MPSTADRFEFAPPAQPGMVRAFSLAVLAHILLLAALTWGVNWKRQTITTTAEAELWASVPQQAAPRAPEPVPVPTPPEPQPTPKPAPPVEKPAPPPPKAPDIAVEREKPVPKKPPDKPPEAAPEKKPAEPVKPKVDTAALQREAKQEAQRQAAEEVAQREKDRQEAINRSVRLAGSGAPDSPGTAAQSSGPSSGYGGRVKAKVKPNLVFTGTTTGNPLVSVEVRAAPDGTILGRPRIVKSSGNREWDEAVVRAFEKTEVMPRDTDGRVPSPIIVDWRVND